jgi:hypothetical protein
LLSVTITIPSLCGHAAGAFVCGHGTTATLVRLLWAHGCTFTG